MIHYIMFCWVLELVWELWESRVSYNIIINEVATTGFFLYAGIVSSTTWIISLVFANFLDIGNNDPYYFERIHHSTILYSFYPPPTLVSLPIFVSSTKPCILYQTLNPLQTFSFNPCYLYQSTFSPAIVLPWLGLNYLFWVLKILTYRRIHKNYTFYCSKFKKI